MIRVLTAAVIGLTLLAGLQSWRLSKWQGRAETAEARVSGFEVAARIRAEQDRIQADLRADADQLDHDLSTQEGADAPLSDYLRDAAGRLWQ